AGPRARGRPASAQVSPRRRPEAGAPRGTAKGIRAEVPGWAAEPCRGAPPRSRRADRARARRPRAPPAPRDLVRAPASRGLQVIPEVRPQQGLLELPRRDGEVRKGLRRGTSGVGVALSEGRRHERLEEGGL